MSARSPFDLLGFADFGQLLQDYHRKRNGGAPVDALPREVPPEGTEC